MGMGEGEGEAEDTTWDRLRQRKLAQWAVGYAAAGWLALQVAQLLGGIYGWPDAWLRWLVAALLVGFAPAMALAWFHGQRGRQRVSRGEVALVAGLLAIGAGLAWWLRPTAAPPDAPPAAKVAPAAPVVDATPAIPTDKSLAVLPFENLSGDPENAYFVSGMQDLILTNLSKLGELRVISRTSTEHYASRPARLSEIGAELGVATILEGSVQRHGDQVLINLQLVDARTDGHLWAETYRRDVADIFEVEEEIAGKVADALRARLTAEETAALGVRPTRDAEALDWFLRAEQNHHVGYRDQDATALAEAAGQYRRALARDPAFTQAWARLATCLTNLSWLAGATKSDARQLATEARAALAQALAQDPALPDANLASAWLRYRVDGDYAGAIEAFDLALRQRPGNVEALVGRATARRRDGQFVAALADFDAALKLNPRDSELATDRAVTLWMLRRTAGAEAGFRRALTLDASNAYARSFLGQLLLERDGDPAAALAVLQGDGEQLAQMRMTALSYAGRPREALQVLRALPRPDASAYIRAQRALSEGLLLDAAGDAGGMREALARADRDFEAALPALGQSQPVARTWASVAISAALQHQEARALDAMRRARAAADAHADRLTAVRLAATSATVDLMLGRTSQGLSQLSRLRANPAAGQDMSAAVLRLQPRLREARKDPRVQQEIRAWEAMEREALRRECEGTGPVQDSPVCRRHSAA
jgi:TolB-like protein/Flp pilus assembly protein TadD